MHNIKNLKDPTRWLLLLLLALLIPASPTIGVGETVPTTKVNCIPHDTKITCDCHNVDQPMVLPALQGAVYQVEVRNCRDLIVDAKSLAEIEGLHKINFRDVGNLVLNKYALSVPRFASNKALIVEFDQVHFKLIDSHAINGNIGEISFVGGRIEVIQPFGFTTTKDSVILLKLDGVQVDRIESQAFKKFTIEKMLITNCHFTGNVPTRAFYELEVLNELSIAGNRFQELHSHAFSFKLISKLSISENQFAGVDGEWLEANILDSIVLRGNNFGVTSEIAFRSIKVHRDYQLSEPLELRFHNNTVRTAIAMDMMGLPPSSSSSISSLMLPQPLRFNDRFALNLRQLQYDNLWNCGELDMNAKPPLPKSEFFRTHSEQLYFQHEDNTDFIDNHIIKNDFIQLRQLIGEQCTQRSYVAYIVIGSVCLALVVMLIVVLVWCLLMRRRRLRKMDVVKPEPRTYKETQIIYQIENAGLLKTDL